MTTWRHDRHQRPVLRQFARLSPGGRGFPLTLVLMCAAAYGWFIVVPYYVNNLDEVPLAELAGGLHDPMELWPRTTAAGELVWGSR